ncbi:MAG TPA: ribonuclease PH [Isosphaeraceae bacterium]|nr:ribonuclease PH [Isosphaeraceae bacterium]
MPRHDGRLPDALRPITIERGFQKTSPGSVLFRAGGTTVLVSAQVVEKVPPFLEGKGVGWLTAEYGMLPGSTPSRKSRGSDGRSTEIQRLIGRSLRAAVDTTKLGPWTVHVDADVLEADGGTRTAAITAAFVSVADALRARLGESARGLLRGPLAAVSVGIVGGQPVLDLDYVEDSTAEVDFNVVRLGQDGFVEVQGTGEGGTFGRAQLDALVDLASAGIDQLVAIQKAALGSDWPFESVSRA